MLDGIILSRSPSLSPVVFVRVVFYLPSFSPYNYVDDLLNGLERFGVGCQWRSLFVGAVYYANDLALLASTPSALCLMLHLCEEFALSHGLHFNSSKT